MFDALEQLGIHRAAITWFDNVVDLGRGYVMALGLCEYSKGVAFIAVYNPNKPIDDEFLKLLVVKDVLYGEWKGKDSCDDAEWCLNLKCPYNKARAKRFAKYGVKNKKMLERLHRLAEDAKEKLNLEPQGPIVLSYRKPPLKRALKKLKPEGILENEG